ncbi:DRIM domain-containing protein [Mycena chlorophos]|uniref:DRIM domain-containing protein n=1 Tax=Mycena chlorophos TaxID=658473 RepID=A0A8H6TFP2_MYCCL|nr:DRIM domain-containing protein [Mycena chlorophos]
MNHVLRQLQLLVPGALATYYLHTIDHLQTTLDATDSWAQLATRATLGLYAFTIALFVYIIAAPWIHGVQPDFARWRQSGVLSTVIPLLTLSIVTGWLGLTLTLGRWTDMGWLRAVVAASAAYAATFGCLGLIPAKGIRGQRKSD